jgi:hypothetical protein
MEIFSTDGLTDVFRALYLLSSSPAAMKAAEGPVEADVGQGQD